MNELLTRFYKFNTSEAVINANIEGLKRKRIYAPAKFLSLVLPYKLFCAIIAVMFIFGDRATDQVQQGKKIVFFAPTKNNFVILVRVLKLVKIYLARDNSKCMTISKLARLRLVVPIFRQVSLLEKNVEISTTVQLIRLLVANEIFKNLDLNGVLFVANDHTPLSIALVYQARLKGLAVVYIQHGPVTQDFPKLAFDLSILFNQRSVQTYRDIDNTLSDFKYTVLSPHEADASPLIVKKKLRKIVISLGVSPNLTKVMQIVRTIKIKYDVIISIRPHPRTPDRIVLKVFELLELAPEALETSSDWEKFDLHFVGNSGVLIDALHHGVPSVYCSDLDTLGFDVYGFFHNGIVPDLKMFMDGGLKQLQAFYGKKWRKSFALLDETINTPIKIQREKAIWLLEEIIEKHGEKPN